MTGMKAQDAIERIEGITCGIINYVLSRPAGSCIKTGALSIKQPVKITNKINKRTPINQTANLMDEGPFIFMGISILLRKGYGSPCSGFSPVSWVLRLSNM